jgi:flagellar hook-associated protein 3 FlgL
MRVTTAQSYQSSLLSLQLGQSKVNDALNQVQTGLLGNDLKAFAPRAETLIASRTVQVRTDTHIANNEALSAKLKVQDAALGRVVQGANAAVDAVTKALANNDGGAVMAGLQAAMDQIVAGLNTSYTGGYLFSGGLMDAPPVVLTKIGQLDTPPPPPPAVPAPRPNPFANGPLAAVSRLDDDTTQVTGFLADDVAGPLFGALADVAAFPDTNFAAPLTQAQHDFLDQLLTKLTGGAARATDFQAQNGAIQAKVEDNLNTLRDRKDMVKALIGNITDADPVEASARLSAAQTALQASAKAFTTLQSSSLLDLLTR